MSAFVELHEDCLGRSWAIAKLDALLAEPGITVNAMSILAIGLQPDGGFRMKPAFNVARLRYRRPEPAALLAVLAARLWWLRKEGRLADASL